MLIVLHVLSVILTLISSAKSADHVRLDVPLAPQVLPASPVCRPMFSILLVNPVCYVISLLGITSLPRDFVLPAIVPVRHVMVLLLIA